MTISGNRTRTGTWRGGGGGSFEAKDTVLLNGTVSAFACGGLGKGAGG